MLSTVANEAFVTGDGSSNGVRLSSSFWWGRSNSLVDSAAMCFACPGGSWRLHRVNSQCHNSLPALISISLGADARMGRLFAQLEVI